ncbi:nicotinate-nucleotide--dimethylbenzimidazole phosphoribosyltransferase [Algiphilus sp.]|uniref:nicotinate-nucleotide--dimethylbenzimidazole phosphoribosyltransferase n=1 Tax=Algiphilus sp. TaxID=1872431 RepID=UPI003B52FCB8
MNESVPTDWLDQPARPLDQAAAQAATERQGRLTKPPGALGQLEYLAIRLAAMQGRTCPAVDQVAITVFAADHGIAAAGVSAFPQSVTAAMVRNFLRGGAAISVAARSLGAQLSIVDVGVAHPVEVPADAVAHFYKHAVAAGTADSRSGPAMTPAQCAQALDAGRASVDAALAAGAQLYIGGEMGIANTTAAAALACLLTDASATRLCGPGTGLDAAGVAHKVEVVDALIHRHAADSAGDALEALRRVGGFEIAALVGALVRCAQRGLPALVDGFIVSVAALVAQRLCPDVADWCFYAHQSAEPGHRHVLDACGAQPLLALDMRLGEGTGAAMAVPLLRMACDLHAGMATFDEAGVADGQ